MSINTHSERLSLLELRMAATEGVLREIQASQNQMLEEMHRTRGFIGGVMFFGGLIGTFLYMTKDWLLGHFTR